MEPVARGNGPTSKPMTSSPDAKSGSKSRRREFERLVTQCQSDLLSAALRMTGNHADAEDVAQDALVRAYTAFGQFQSGTNFRAWMLRIVTNTYINEFRRKRRQPDFTTWDAVPREDLGKLSRAGREPGPGDALLARSLDVEVDDALEQLPDSFREAVVLCDIHSLSYTEIAEALGVPIGTVRSRIARGRRLLEQALAEYARARGLI